MKSTIVFCLNVNDEESYGEIANFIYKCENAEDITEDDVKRVVYKQYLNNENRTARELVKQIVLDKEKFKGIIWPEKLKNVKEQYKVIYCFCIDKEADIVDLGNLYLLMHYYEKLDMVALFSECEDTQYHKISQFLYSIDHKNVLFYNRCFYEYRGNIQRAQIHNITFSRAFSPLQVIDADNLKSLFSKCNFESLETDELLNGACKILCDVQKTSFSKIMEQNGQIFYGLERLTFVLLCYSICQTGKKLERQFLVEYAYQMQQYSNAIRQLAENIVYHSKTGCGILALRVHNKKSSYIQKKYYTEAMGENALELIISDFCGNNLNGNIATNFVSNLDDSQMKSLFQNLQPKSFFDHTSHTSYQSVWDTFYQNPAHIGKHFGLKIFQSIIRNYDGIFAAESHSGYYNMPGDSFLSYQGGESVNCMPGTRYHIVFPIENIQKTINNRDMSLDSGINLDVHIKEYLNYTVDDMELSLQSGIPDSQQSKDELIRRIGDEIRQNMESKDRDIIYVSLEDYMEVTGEIIAKAFVIAFYYLKRNVRVVLYQCTDDLKKSIFDTICIFFHNTDLEGMFYEKNVYLILYSKNFEETVLDLSSSRQTDNINAYISQMKCINSVVGYVHNDVVCYDLKKGADTYIPCDVLHKVIINDRKQTLFEHYTEGILKSNIQKNEFGCQLEHTHMRLGSTIHIDKFYEAEILFGNKLFISRFALLLVKDMREEILDIEKLTLYGYGTYSESVLVQMIELIDSLYDGQKDVDYIILEREEERRGFLHKDRIRYNKDFNSKEERVSYFKDRKVAIIVLINSTLKTHMRLINFYREENDISMDDTQWLMKNYAVLLAGNSVDNGYWTMEENDGTLANTSIVPKPQYFIQLEVRYEEPEKCVHCFPDEPVAEVPLIEVNAASTIPNQGFGIIEEPAKKSFRVEEQVIRDIEEKLSCLKNEFIYGHIHRNENHFLYYFKTENICVKNKKEIKLSLEKWKNGQKDEEFSQYNIIVAPMHFSNAGFVELVNNVVFEGNAILLRIDFDKEYRCNAYTKYSYLRNYIQQLKELVRNGIVNVHFVDDAIISGRTFYRAKSLINTVLGTENKGKPSIQINVFKKVFVLVDRNSYDSRNQYVIDSDYDFFAFTKVNISSLRNYGDSCVYCNLKKEADLLYDTASTKSVAEYWRHCGEKFQLYSLEEYSEKFKDTDGNKQFRRLFCTHMAEYILNEKYHRNNKEQAVYLILQLVYEDYKSRKEDKFEYFLSYLKCISRPFLVFKKNIKEAVFDIMLIILDAIVCNRSIDMAISRVEAQKPYLKQRILIRQFKQLDTDILNDKELSDANKADLVRVLMKQLTELKSNYLIRPEKMDALFAYMADKGNENFEKFYITLIDRLVGASSDTNKSMWLDNKIVNSHFDSVREEFRIWVLLENTRAFRDGIEKFYIRIYEEGKSSQFFTKIVDDRIKELEDIYDYNRAQKMFSNFAEKYYSELEAYAQAENVDTEVMQNTKERIERFVRSLPELNTINFVSVYDAQCKADYNPVQAFWHMQQELEDDCTTVRDKREEYSVQAQLLECIEIENDEYQYGNFYQLLKNEGYFENDCLSGEGADMIICCVKVLQICRNNEDDILTKIQLLATLFKIIVNAKKVQFIIENKKDNNLDRWKQSLEVAYNEIVDKVNERKGNIVLERISIKRRKHYSVIVEKAGSGDYNTEVSEGTENLIGTLEKNIDGQNFIFGEDGTFLWRLENNQRSIWVCIENDEWGKEELTDRIRAARDVRKVMMFYRELMDKIFNPENDDYINEISHARKRLSIYNSSKVNSHTKDYARKVIFEQAERYYDTASSPNRENYMKYYPSHILKLLADINISQYYRYGLKDNDYEDKRELGETAKWEDVGRWIRNGQTYFYSVGTDKVVGIGLKVSDIGKNVKILCRNNNNDIREMTLLIYALILNAAEQNRGKRQIEKIGVQQAVERVILNLYKADGYLIIENECEGNVDIQKIRRKLHHIPNSEEDGISLWSFNYYIQSCINSLVRAKIRDIKQSLGEDDNRTIADMKNAAKWIKMLMSDEYHIQPELGTNKEEKKVFRVKVPIFMEKFQLDQSRGGRKDD